VTLPGSSLAGLMIRRRATAIASGGRLLHGGVRIGQCESGADATKTAISDIYLVPLCRAVPLNPIAYF
jgi:hypothetical protein